MPSVLGPTRLGTPLAPAAPHGPGNRSPLEQARVAPVMACPGRTSVAARPPGGQAARMRRRRGAGEAPIRHVGPASREARSFIFSSLYLMFSEIPNQPRGAEFDCFGVS